MSELENWERELLGLEILPVSRRTRVADFLRYVWAVVRHPRVPRHLA